MIKAKNYSLWKHQEAAAHYMLEHDYALLAMGMRTGKTLTTLHYLVLTQPAITLVVTTTKGIKVWENEINKSISGVEVVSLTSGTSAAKAKKLGTISSQPTVILVNYQSVWRAPILAALYRLALEVIVLDESHYIKAHNSMVSKAMYKLGRIARKRYCLTGTPLPNSPLDIYGQARFLNQELFTIDGKQLLRSFGAFKSRYAVQQSFGTIQIVRGYKNLHELHEIMNTFTFRVESSQVLDLPDALHITKLVELSDKARAIYTEFNREMMVELESGVLTADNALVKALRLQQITGGFISDDHVDVSKLEMLQNIVNELDENEPLVVFARFTHEIEAIHAALFSSSILSGKYNELDAWLQGQTQVLIVQIRTGAEAINLSRASRVVFYSMDYSAGVHSQALARVAGHDQQADRVTYYYLVAENTIDEAIIKSLADKTKVKESIMKHIREYKL